MANRIRGRGILLITQTTAVAVAACSIAAANPFLSESPWHEHWHIPPDTNDAVFIGTKESGDPKLLLNEQPMAESPVTLRIVSDAQRCRITSGDVSFSFPTTPGQTLRLRMDANEHRPRLEIDGQEPAMFRGQWTRLVVKGDRPQVELELVGAGYATVRFSQKADSSTGSEADQPTQPPPAVRVVRRDPLQPQRQNSPSDQPPPNAGTWIPSFEAGLNLPSAYFYRGIGQENSDLIVQPWANVHISVIQNNWMDLLNGVDLDVGVLSSHHFGETGDRPANGGREKFYELDFIGGATAKVFDRWALGVHYLNRIGVNNNLTDVHQVEFRVQFDDSDPDYNFQFWPYALFSIEFEGESDAGNGNFDQSDQGVYLELGIRPSFEIVRIDPYRPIKLTIPTVLGLSLSNYYEDASGHDDVFGYFQLGAEVSYPLIIAKGEPGRRFVLQVTGGVDLLFLGNNAQAISELNGTGANSVQVIGKVGLSLDY